MPIKSGTPNRVLITSNGKLSWLFLDVLLKFTYIFLVFLQMQPDLYAVLLMLLNKTKCLVNSLNYFVPSRPHNYGTET